MPVGRSGWIGWPVGHDRPWSPDLAAIRCGDPQRAGLIGVTADGELAAVVLSVVSSAHCDQVRDGVGTAVFPVDHVVDLEPVA
jgi:hypothetical protein